METETEMTVEQERDDMQKCANAFGDELVKAGYQFELAIIGKLSGVNRTSFCAPVYKGYLAARLLKETE